MNNKIYWLIVLLFLLVANKGISQTDAVVNSSDFLKNYIPPNYKFQRLFLNPSLRESLVRSDALDRNRFSANIFANYFLNSQADYSDTFLSIFFQSGFVSDKRNQVQTANDNAFTNSVSIAGDFYYYLSGEAFVSFGTNTSSNNRNLYLAENSNTSNHSISIPISIGFGRPYQVTDAWTTMTLFNDLECYGIASDRSQTKEVADLMSALRNTRFLDNRLGRIQNRAALLNYLNDNDIVDLTALSSSVIHDTYRFEFAFTRYSGFRIRGGVIPKMVVTRVGNGTEYIIDSGISLSPFFNFDYFMPLSEDWQLDIYNLVTFEDDEFSMVNAFKTANSVRLNWYPNLRTRAGAELNYNGFDNPTLSLHTLRLGLTFEYYLSPAVQFTLSSFVSNEWRDGFGQKSETFDQVFSGGFIYRFI